MGLRRAISYQYCNAIYRPAYIKCKYYNNTIDNNHRYKKYLLFLHSSLSFFLQMHNKLYKKSSVLA